MAAQGDDRQAAARSARLNAVIASIYDQMLLAFNRSIDNLGSHDPHPNPPTVPHQVTDTVHLMQSAGRNVLERTQQIVGPSPAEIEQAVQNALHDLGIPSRERVEKIGRELDALNELLDQRLAERRAAQEKA